MVLSHRDVEAQVDLQTLYTNPAREPPPSPPTPPSVQYGGLVHCGESANWVTTNCKTLIWRWRPFRWTACQGVVGGEQIVLAAVQIVRVVCRV